MAKDLGKLSDRQLLEAIYIELSDRLERVENKVDGVAVQAASAVTAANKAWAQSEQSAGKVDALITDTRALDDKVRKGISESRAVQKLARDRIVEAEKRISSVERRVASGRG